MSVALVEQDRADNHATIEKIIDLRSDTLTKPDDGMRAAMAAAEVGDDVYSEDPTVNRLEAVMAERFGKEAALFVSSGTQGNLTALLSHCGRGEEFITGGIYHTHKYEAGGAAALGGIVPFAVPVADDGALEAGDVAAAIKADDIHFPISRLLSLENTNMGRVVSVERMAGPIGAARAKGLSVHLDGARIFNAAIALGIDVAELTKPIDSVSVCLSKGLGAPVGSVLVGPADVIARARRWRKMLGGGLRQAGVLAAAGLYALDHNVARLADDHDRARRLAEGIADLPLGVDPAAQQTNMVYIHPAAEDADPLRAFLQQRGILIGKGNPSRLVVHLDVTEADIARTISSFHAFFQN